MHNQATNCMHSKATKLYTLVISSVLMRCHAVFIYDSSLEFRHQQVSSH